MTKPSISKKVVIITLISVLVVSGGLILWSGQQNKVTPSNTSPNADTGTSPTAPEPQTPSNEAEQRKNELVEQNNSTNQQTDGKKQATLVITNANQSSINAYIIGILEDGGTCTATFTKGDTSIVRTSQGFANVSVTNCTPINPNLPSSGTWNFQLEYKSADATGKTTGSVEVE